MVEDDSSRVNVVGYISAFISFLQSSSALFNYTTKTPTEIVHSNLYRPINPVSNGGQQYILTFIDDLSRKPWVYFLQENHKDILFLWASGLR